ncbi:synaptic vesicle glycoprotein 2B-like isoform X1 [Venturia canescens]|uniref:synaptic vesicle glycoprotein 2B-like isoform X1 n=1 Tax=Venturia canescens TaxID=32260 RepID=UPI001C9D0EC0|nr:synaptic vesicle glycoprotein 2B-like isoform X1 [Venturia canescens]
MKIGDDELSKNVSIAESVAENAVNQAGFGKFNYKIMAVCGLMYFNYGFGISSLGIVMPSAACDFEMTTVDKSRLSVSAALGMLCGAYFWGCTADIKGRKFTLIAALMLHGGFDGMSAVVSNYWLFVATKFFSGLGMSGELAVVFPYLGEFQPTHLRDRILTWMELAWVFGFTVVPAIAWGIIPLNFGYHTTYFFFNSWNLFMLLCSIPSILIAVQLYCLPETPKYLAESGQYAELLNVLERMFSDNTGAPVGEYAIKISKMGDSTLDELISLARSTETKRKNRRTVADKIASFRNQTVMMFRPPYLITTLIIGTVMMCLMSSYFTLVMWLPEVFNRFATFESRYPGEVANICSITDRLRQNTTNLLTSGLDSQNETMACEIGIQTDVYLHSIILGITSVPTAIWLPLFVERLGYVFHLVLGSFICTAVICGLFFVTTSVQNLVLACVFEAIASICITAVLCMLVELYPTNLRVMAAAFATFIGRVGCFAGSGLFGYLIDDYCIPLISIIAGQFFLSGVLCLFIPLKSKRQNRSETSKP